MNERDELADLIATEAVKNVRETEIRRCAPDGETPVFDIDEQIADVILAAGYSKPRTITTAEELDALPVDSVVRTEAGNIFEKGCYPDEPDFPFWITPGMQRMFAAKMLGLPATVLWEPK